MGYPKQATFETLRTVAFGAIGAGYSAVGAAFTEPVRLLGITNTTDQNVFFSDDGVNDKVIIPSGSGKVFDVTTNRTNQENLFLGEGRFAYIRRAGGAPASGAVYIETVIGV